MINLKEQQGVTLIISLVLLASVSFVTFAISTLILREIAGARLILQTEPAISGANSGGEIALFRLARGSGNIDSSGSLLASNANYQIVSDLYDDPFPFSIASGGELRVSLYDASDPNNLSANFGSVTVTNNPSGQSNPLKLQIFSFGDLTTGLCGTTGGATIGTGQSLVCATLNSADDRYLLILTPTGNNSASGQIQTTNNQGASRGVPSIFPELEITGTRGNVQRKIQIRLSEP